MLLGRLDPAMLASVEGGVTMDHLEAVFSEKLGAPLGVDARTAAEAVIAMANAKMAGAIRLVSLSLGADPRDFALFAFGGAGPLHATAIARELGVPRVLIPARPGLTNALGCVVADLRHDYVRTVNVALDDMDVSALHAVFADQSAAGQAALAREAVAIRETRFEYSLDMQFLGQSHVVRVPFDTATPDREAIRAAFEEVYFARFRVELPEIRARIVNVATSVIGLRDPVDLSGLIDASGRKAMAVPTAHRAVPLRRRNP